MREDAVSAADGDAASRRAGRRSTRVDQKVGAGTSGCCEVAATVTQAWMAVPALGEGWDVSPDLACRRLNSSQERWSKSSTRRRVPTTEAMSAGRLRVGR